MEGIRRFRGRVRRVLANGTVIVAPDSAGLMEEIEVPRRQVEADRPLGRGHRVEFSIVRGVGRRLRLVTVGRP
jgi:hypothetical protein